MKPKEFEREILTALREPKFWARWGRSLSLGLLSPHGQRISRAITYCHAANKGVLVALPEVKAAMRREGEVGESLRTLAREVCERNGAASVEVQASLAGEVLTRSTLENLIRRASEQLQTGKLDLDGLVGSVREVTPDGEHVRRFDP